MLDATNGMIITAAENAESIAKRLKNGIEVITSNQLRDLEAEAGYLMMLIRRAREHEYGK